jgi:nucleotide-binding universal stress UspA family protein
MDDYGNKLLVALDGSARSRDTVQYVAKFTPFRSFDPVLLNVMSRVPESYYDLQSPDFNPAALSRVRVWENSRKALMDEHMSRARNKLIAAGFKPEQVSIMVKGREKGVARDIMAEARKGYHALVLRRRGWASAVLPLALGSVSTKILEKAVEVPVVLAGVQPVTQNLLLAFDGSAGALNAVRFVGKTIHDSQCRIVMATVIRDATEGADDLEDPGPDFWPEGMGQALDEAMGQARDILAQSGIRSDRILVRSVQGVKSRAQALADIAMSEGCGTIVLGRRGKSNVSEFTIGRVPWKVVHGARKMTVWVVP